MILLKNITKFMQHIKTQDGIIKARPDRIISVPDKTNYDKTSWQVQQVIGQDNEKRPLNNKARRNKKSEEDR